METPLDSNSVYCWKIPLPLSFEIFSACAPRDSSQTFDFEGAGRIQLGLIQRRQRPARPLRTDGSLSFPDQAGRAEPVRDELKTLTGSGAYLL